VARRAAQVKRLAHGPSAAANFDQPGLAPGFQRRTSPLFHEDRMGPNVRAPEVVEHYDQ